jgi:hypothetical protein
MKKSLLSLMLVCCFAIMGVAQTQNAIDGIKVQSYPGIATMLSTDRGNMDYDELLTYIPIEELENLQVTILGFGMEAAWGAMFPPDMVAPYAGRNITDVIFVDAGPVEGASVTGTYKVQIFVGQDDILDGPDHMVYEQSFEVAGEVTQLMMVHLDTPVPISGNEKVWVMYYQDGSVEYCAPASMGVSIENNRWLCAYDFWFDLAALGAEYAIYSWLVWAVVDGYEVIGENTADVAVYPNPTSDYVTIQALNMNHITVLNTIGQVVYDANVEGSLQTLDMSQYEAGVYMVRVATENGVKTQRVVVR